jgi:hypothetical protein
MTTHSDRSDVKKNEEGIEVAATFNHAVIGSVSAETNTPMGGDGGHGGVTSVLLRFDGGWLAHHPEGTTEHTDWLNLRADGDAEAAVLADMLEFAAKSLREQMAANAQKRRD